MPVGQLSAQLPEEPQSRDAVLQQQSIWGQCIKGKLALGHKHIAVAEMSAAETNNSAGTSFT